MARLLCAVLCAVLFACVYSFPARANDVHVGTGLVCDTKEQVALFASLFEEKGGQGAIAAVNQDAGAENACVVATVAFIVVEEYNRVEMAEKSYVIVKILVSGVWMNGQMVPIEPKEFYSIFVDEAEGRPA